MDLKIKNKIAFVSGSTAGIGFAIAKRLSQEGAEVIINSRTQQRYPALRQTFRKWKM